jgi:hypothetical protein
MCLSFLLGCWKTLSLQGDYFVRAEQRLKERREAERLAATKAAASSKDTLSPLKQQQRQPLHHKSGDSDQEDVVSPHSDAGGGTDRSDVGRQDSVGEYSDSCEIDVPVSDAEHSNENGGDDWF